MQNVETRSFYIGGAVLLATATLELIGTAGSAGGSRRWIPT